MFTLGPTCTCLNQASCHDLVEITVTLKLCKFYLIHSTCYYVPSLNHQPLLLESKHSCLKSCQTMEPAGSHVVAGTWIMCVDGLLDIPHRSQKTSALGPHLFIIYRRLFWSQSSVENWKLYKNQTLWPIPEVPAVISSVVLQRGPLQRLWCRVIENGVHFM